MLTLYIICFWVGLILTLVTTLFGGGHNFDMDLDSHSAHAPHGGGHSPFNLTTLLAFLTGFGGVGYILLKMSMISGLLILLIASTTGLAIAAVLFIFLSKVLMRDDHVMREDLYQLEGMLGTVITSIPKNGVGEIKFVLQGTTRSIGARDENGKRIDRGTKVVILHMEKGIAVVSAFEAL